MRTAARELGILYADFGCGLGYGRVVETMTAKSGSGENEFDRVPGDVLALNIGDGSYAYCRVLEGAECEFFNLRTKGVSTVEEVVAADVAFTVPVSPGPILSGRWKRIGHLSLEARPAPFQTYFHQDLVTNEVQLIENGVFRPGTPDEARCLERAAGWDGLHVEDRLRDMFADKPNKWVEQLKVR